MLKEKILKKVLSVTSAIAILGTMCAPSLVIPSLAAPETPSTGSATVFYTSEGSLPEFDTPQWGVKIPSGVSFSDADLNVEKTGEQYDIQLVTVNPDGKLLTEIYDNLTVKAEVDSKNGFQFTKDGEPDAMGVGGYSYKANGQLVSKATGNQTIGDMNLTTAEKMKITGGFTLEETLTEAGNYKDILTFTFTETASAFKGK